MKTPKFIQNLLNSFKSNSEGYSARKLTSFVIVNLAIYVHTQYVDETNVTTILFLDYAFVALLLGLVTAAQLIQLKNGDKPNDDE